MLIDIHQHHAKSDPDEIKALRYRFDLKHLKPLLREAQYHESIIECAQWVRNIFVDKNTNVMPILTLYNGSQTEYEEALQCEMQIAGIQQGVIQMIDYGDNLHDYKVELGIARRYANQYNQKAFIGINPDRPEEEINDLVKNYSPHFDGFKLYGALSRKVQRVWSMLASVAVRDNKPIMSHCSPNGIGDHKKNNNPEIWSDILFDNPKLRLCFAHGGGTSKEFQAAIQKLGLEYVSIYIDTAFWDDLFFNPERAFRKIRELIESNVFVMFGSDYPLHVIYYTYGQFVQLLFDNLSQWQQQQIFSINGAEYLGLKRIENGKI